MLFTFVAEYLLGGGCVVQVNSSDHQNALRMIKECKIPAYGDNPEYFPFENVELRELSSYHVPEITSDGILLIYEIL